MRSKTFLPFLSLISIWAFFFATIKFFLWGTSGESLSIDLQSISGYLSMGSFIAFLVGGAIASTFLKKYLLMTLSSVAIALLLTSYIAPIDSGIRLALTTMMIGMVYGLWNVTKSILLITEMEKTQMSETKITAIASGIFIISLILGSVVGNILTTRWGLHGYTAILALMSIGLFVSSLLDYDEITFRSLFTKGWKDYFGGRKNRFQEAIKRFIPDLKYVTRYFGALIIISSTFWAVSTIISQAAFEESITLLEITREKASLLMVASAIGAIIGNIASIPLAKNRNIVLIILMLVFAIVTYGLVYIPDSYTDFLICSTVIGVLFGSISNLLDSYILKSIGAANKKEYGASAYGVIFSVILSSLLFIASAIDSRWGYEALITSLGALILVTAGGYMALSRQNLCTK